MQATIYKLVSDASFDFLSGPARLFYVDPVGRHFEWLPYVVKIAWFA
jgi:hypothetical protein